MLVRIIFTIRPNGEILLLHAFIKRQSWDTLQALEQALNVLAQVRSRPELAAALTMSASALALDHTSINTQAAGYTTGSSTVTTTKTIGPLDRNDMSYVPATTVKNGVTLNLASVDWQVIGAGLWGTLWLPAPIRP